MFSVCTLLPKRSVYVREVSGKFNHGPELAGKSTVAACLWGCASFCCSSGALPAIFSAKSASMSKKSKKQNDVGGVKV